MEEDMRRETWRKTGSSHTGELGKARKEDEEDQHE